MKENFKMVKYQFFVGSTYKDLVDERQVAINAIIETNNIVAGMEFFGAVGENQLEHIKQEIDQTDYYLLIIGGRYGSLTKSGISYTEEEYDYAVLNGVRVIAFIHSNPESLAYNKSETNSSNREKLENFKTKVQNSGLVCFWDNLNDLKSKIVTTIYNVINKYPATGWKRIQENNKDEQDTDDLYIRFNAQKRKAINILFPSVKHHISYEEISVSYDFDYPHRAIFRSENHYVQLEVRDGMIQEWMKLTCKDYVEYIDDLNAQLNQNMIICLRKIWFNTVSPEIIAYIDFLHDTSISVNSLLTIKQIKEWFYDGEVLTDGCSHGVYVRVFQEFFLSDHFYSNNDKYYLPMGENAIKSTLQKTEFDKENGIIRCQLLIENANTFPVSFEITGWFFIPLEDNWPGCKSLTGIKGQNTTGSNIFDLSASESKVMECLFIPKSELLDYKPNDMHISIMDKTYEYQ